MVDLADKACSNDERTISAFCGCLQENLVTLSSMCARVNPHHCGMASRRRVASHEVLCCFHYTALNVDATWLFEEVSVEISA